MTTQSESTPNSKGLTRLNVNLNQETADLLRKLNEDEGVSFTEAVRRGIVTYGYLRERAHAGDRIVIKSKFGIERELVIL